MKSKGRLILDSVLGIGDSLLIIVPPFINSLLSAMVIFHERFRRGFITHLTLLTLSQLDYLDNTVANYNSVLLIDPPTVVKSEDLAGMFRGKKLFVISSGDVEWLSPEYHLEYSGSLSQLLWQLLGNELDRDSMRFLEASRVYESTALPSLDSSFNGWLNVEPTNYMALPGLLRLPLSTAISRAFSPALPGLTGNEAEARAIVRAISRRSDATYKDLTEDQLLDLLKYLGDFILRAGLRGEYLDRLVFTNKRWVGSDVDVMDSVLAIEAQLVLWEYAGGVVSPIMNPRSVAEMDNIINKYASLLGNYLNQLSKGGSIALDNQQLTLADRLCSTLNFRTERHDVEFSVPEGSVKVGCVFEGDVEDADLVFKRWDYSVVVRGLFGEGQG